MKGERLSARLARMSAACSGEAVSLRALLPDLGPGDHALVALFVALCSMPPLPMPGLSMLLAATALTAGMRMAAGLGLWMPRAVAERRFPARGPGRLLGLASRCAARVEVLIRPRAQWLTRRPWSRTANGCAIALCGLMLFIPLPPPTNVPPAVALLLLSLGVLESDGLLIALGYAAALASAAFFAGLASLGWSGATALLASF